MHIEVTGVTLVTITKDTDTLYLETNLPEGTWPFKRAAKVMIPVAKGTGVQYVKDNFPDVPFENLGE